MAFKLMMQAAGCRPDRGRASRINCLEPDRLGANNTTTRCQRESGGRESARDKHAAENQ